MVRNAEYYARGPYLGHLIYLFIIYIYRRLAASQEQEKLSSRTDVDLRTRLWNGKTLIFRLRKA
jgi:hypothetical protein